MTVTPTVAMVTLLAVPDVGLLAQLLDLGVDVVLHRSQVVLDGAAARRHTHQGAAKTHYHFLEATSKLEWEDEQMHRGNGPCACVHCLYHDIIQIV